MKTKDNSNDNNSESPWMGWLTAAGLGACIMALFIFCWIEPFTKKKARYKGYEEGKRTFVREAIDYGHAEYRVGKYGGTSWHWKQNCTNTTTSIGGGWIITHASMEHAE